MKLLSFMFRWPVKEIPYFFSANRPTSAQCTLFGAEATWANCHLLISCLIKYELGLGIVLKIEELYLNIIRGCIQPPGEMLVINC